MTVIFTSQPALLRTCIELQVDTNQHIPTINMTSHAALWIPELLEQILLNTDMCTEYIANLSPESLPLLERGDSQIQTSPISFILPTSQPSKESCAANPHPKPAVRKIVLALWN